MTLNEVMDILDKKADGAFLFSCIGKNNIEEAISYIMEFCKCDEITAKAALVDVKTQYYDPICNKPSDLTPQQIAHNNQVATEALNKPKCPTCSSQNLKKISTTSKAVNTIAFGIFGTKRNKTFHCNNCGYEW